MIKKFFLNTIVKSVIFLILPLIYSTTFSYAISAVENEVIRSYLYIFCAFVLVLHIVVLIVYGKVDKNQKKKLNDFENSKEKDPIELNNLKRLLNSYSKVILDNANDLYDIVKNKKDHSDIINWSYMQAKGDDICEAIYNFIKRIKEQGENFSVSMIFKMERDGINGYTMMSRSSNDAAYNPKSYRNFIPESEAEDMFYKKIFDENPNRPKILLTKKEISIHFTKISDIEYSQYIAIPISCKGKIIGITQIVAYSGSIISKNRQEINRLCNDYFSMATNIMLLTDKNENIHQII